AYIVYPNRLLRNDQGLRHPQFKFEIEIAATFSSSVTPGAPAAPNSSIQGTYLAVDWLHGRYYEWNFTGGVGATKNIIGMSIPDNVQFATNSNTVPDGLGGDGLAVAGDGNVYAIGFTSGSTSAFWILDPLTLLPIGVPGQFYPTQGVDWRMYATGLFNPGTGTTPFLVTYGILRYLTVFVGGALVNFVGTSPPVPYMSVAGTDTATSIANDQTVTSGYRVYLTRTTVTLSGTGPGITIGEITPSGAEAQYAEIGSIAIASIDATCTRMTNMGDMIVDPSDGNIIVRATCAASGSGATPNSYWLKVTPTGTIVWKTPDPNNNPANYDYAFNQSLITGGQLWVIDGTGIFDRYVITTATGVITVFNDTFLTGAYDFSGATVPGIAITGLVPNPGIGYNIILYDAAVPGDVSIAEIVHALCLRSGVPDDQIDVTSLTGTVPGYVISTTPMNARDSIVPLRSVGFFDSVESGSILKFVQRGGTIAVTLTPNDIGAFDDSASNQSEDPPPANAVVLSSEIDLPQQVRIQYSAVSRDYQPGTQLSPVRYDTVS